jgi:hypothetical protein
MESFQKEQIYSLEDISCLPLIELDKDKLKDYFKDKAESYINQFLVNFIATLEGEILKIYKKGKLTNLRKAAVFKVAFEEAERNCQSIPKLILDSDENMPYFFETRADNLK